MKKNAKRTRTNQSISKIRMNARRLIHLRGERRWSLVEAAEKAGVSQRTYKRAEGGQEIQVVKATQIAALYHAPLEELEERKSA